MKHLLLLLLIYPLIGFNQINYTPLPDSAGVWSNSYSTYYLDQNMMMYIDYQEYSYYCTHGEDTLINLLNYTKINSCLSGAYKGAFRNDTGKVYFVPKDESVEYLLYDFTAQNGDTLYNVYVEDPGSNNWNLITQTVSIPNPDTVLVNGEYRKTLRFAGTDWIEGIGSITGLFQGSGENVSNFFINLVCHSIMDATEYPSNMEGQPSCYLHLSKENFSLDEFSVFPNPAVEFISVQLPKQMDQVQIHIFSTLGESVYFTQFTNAQYFDLDISQLNSGNYIIQILSEQSVLSKKLIVK